MKHFVLGTAALLFAATGSASAQRAPFNEVGVTMGHWHLNSRDIEVNRKIFVGMGGTSPTGPGIQRVVFPGVVVNLNPGQPGPPPTGGSQGSVVNHVGFVVNNVLGLLHGVSRVISRHGCDVDLVLISTEGQKAIDVFHIAKAGAKLTDAAIADLTADLHRMLEA